MSQSLSEGNMPAATVPPETIRRHVQPETKTADSKGRIALGGKFANRHVIIEWINETEFVVKMARIIPESEAWLYDNPQALAAVRKGLAQARAGKTTRGPDLNDDAKLIAELED